MKNNMENTFGCRCTAKQLFHREFEQQARIQQMHFEIFCPIKKIYIYGIDLNWITLVIKTLKDIYRNSREVNVLVYILFYF